MSARPSLVDAVAIELRWMDHLEAKAGGAHPDAPPVLTRADVWDRISPILKDGYRKDARRLLAVIEPYRRAARAGGGE